MFIWRKCQRAVELTDNRNSFQTTFQHFFLLFRWITDSSELLSRIGHFLPSFRPPVFPFLSHFFSFFLSFSFSSLFLSSRFFENDSRFLIPLEALNDQATLSDHSSLKIQRWNSDGKLFLSIATENDFDGPWSSFYPRDLFESSAALAEVFFGDGNMFSFFLFFFTSKIFWEICCRSLFGAFLSFGEEEEGIG